MRSKYLIWGLVLINIVFIAKDYKRKKEVLHCLNAVNQMRNKLQKSIDYSSIIIEYQDYFDNVKLSQKLRGEFILYIPKQGCNACIDSSLVLLENMKLTNKEFDYKVLAQRYDDYLKKYLRYNKINIDLVKKDDVCGINMHSNYPLLTFYTDDEKFSKIIPISRNHISSVKFCLERLLKNKEKD